MGAVYLAGPMGGLPYGDVRSWRDVATRFLRERGIQVLSPMRWEDQAAPNEAIFRGPFELQPGEGREIIERDSFDVRRADVVLANFLGAKKVSIGTTAEMGWSYQLRKAVVLVMEETGNPHDHPFVTEPAGWRVTDLSSGLTIVSRLLTG